MGLRQPPFAVITVAGTNGKGSTVALCDACLRAAGYRVGAYTSPHLIRYNERIRVDGRMVDDGELCAAFERVEARRGATPLTYFEYGTLAALEVFRARGVDIAVLEVGMGGRLDAVNGVDPDVAVVTAIGIDHTAWLGADRETIAREKAGIFRAHRPAVCSDPDPPAAVAAAAAHVGAPLRQLGRDFTAEHGDGGWTLRVGARVRAGLPYPVLRGDYQVHNAAGALVALEALGTRFPISQAALRAGLLGAAIPGRFQVLPGLPVVVLDVAHNPLAAAVLAATLEQQRVAGRTFAVFGMLIDKDIVSVVSAMAAIVNHWHLATLGGPRGASAEQLRAALTTAGIPAPATVHATPADAYRAAKQAAAAADRIVVFGSFYTVGDILAGLDTTTTL